MESTAAQLIMVYNADGDKVSVLLNMAHKIVSPSTYECSLCSITHGAFTMRARWKEFLVSEDLEKDVAAIRARVEGVTESAITDALNDPLPPVSRAFEDMFANG